MGAVAFNTYDFVKSLADAGMDEKHAAAISAGILRAHEVADLATKADLRESQAQTKADLREEMTALRIEMRESQAQTDAKIDKVEAKLEAQIDKVEAKLEKETTEIKGEIKLLKWMLGVTLTGVGSLIVMAVGLVIKVFFGT